MEGTEGNIDALMTSLSHFHTFLQFKYFQELRGDQSPLTYLGSILTLASIVSSTATLTASDTVLRYHFLNYIL